MTTSPEEIASFLVQFKNTINSSGLLIDHRKENQAGLIELGLTKAAAVQIIMDLTVEDYHAGPEPDDKRGGVVWKFGRFINKSLVNIKLQLMDYIVLETGERKIVAKCISFKPALYSMTFPYHK